ncbi:MAG: hypothetical protein JNN15_18455 [Blastocatellia bacterium]|nr:hypothetical protein [Blastocatellia bacterium]
MTEIPVGLQPVSIAVRNNQEVWTANWLSDSVSIVDLETGNVKQTIDVGDEPTDIAFLNNKAFVSVSELRQIKVFDLDSLDSPPKVISLDVKKPRALSVDPDTMRLFVSVFESGNKTSIVPFRFVREEGGPPAPKPAMSRDLPPAPRTGLIVQETSKGVWADETGDTKWSKYLKYSLEDTDLLVIDAVTLKIKQKVSSVGTHIGNSIFDPSSNKLFVVNTDSKNLIRFEPNVKGRFIRSRVSLIDFSGKKAKAKAVDLNPHIDYNSNASSRDKKQLSIGLPTDIVRTDEGDFYISSTSTAKVALVDSTGNIINRISVGLGPTGLAFDEQRQKLYVLNRFENSISSIDLKEKNETGRTVLGYNPEPEDVREGRLFLYSGEFSSHGDASCASCHNDGHRDGLSWDLGDPQGKLQVVTNDPVPLPFFPSRHVFHPMKGPMMTQSLKGIIGNEPLHWRGDRASLEDFNSAFVTLLGGSRELTQTEMAKFKAFVASLTYPPNPLENLDRTYPSNAERGRQLFNGPKLDIGLLRCVDCHDTSKNGGFGPGTSNYIAPNFLLVGDKESNDVSIDQNIKVPQLRGLYEKTALLPNGKRISGFGYINDGYRQDVIAHLDNPRNFSFASMQDMKDVEAYVLTLDTGIAPTVGLQVTVNTSNKTSTSVTNRLRLLMEQADKNNCDLIVKGIFAGQRRGFSYVGNGMFRTDRASEARISWRALVESVEQKSELTFTGVPVGAGRRMGIDRDSNGVLDGDQ